MALLTSVQMKDVPEEVHTVLRQRPAAAHQSLQEHLLSRLVDEASRPTLDEVLDHAGTRRGGSAPFGDVVAILREERDHR